MPARSDPFDRYPGAVAYTPGDSAALNAEILALMRSGRKTASCDGWDRAVAEGLPRVGRIDMALDWQGRPALATRTLRVEKLAFEDVTEAHVAPQGEFHDLDDWRQGYRAYLSRNGGFEAGMAMMIEHFEIVEDLGGLS